MIELSPEAKKLLEVAREEFSPADQRVAAVRSELEARIQGPRGGTGNGGGGGGAGWAGWSASHWVGIGLVAIGLATVVEMSIAHMPSTANSATPRPSEALPSVAASGAIAPPREQPSLRDSMTSSLGTHATAQSAPTAPAIGSAPRIRLAAQPIVQARHSQVATKLHEPRSSRSSAAASLAYTGASRANNDQPVAVAETDTPAEPASVQPATPSSVEQPGPARPHVDDSLAREIALLKSARAALDRHQPQAALAIADEYAAQFAKGTMRQEQLATRVLALCALKRPAEAVAAKRELERVAPRSPHLMQLRSSCANESTPER